MDARIKAYIAIVMFFVVNVAFNFEASMAEFLLPVVAQELGVSISQSQMILYIYYVAIICTLSISLTSKSPLMTRVSGFLFGGAIFVAGNLLLGLGLGMGPAVVVLARVMQGVGMALVVSATPALIVHWRLAEYFRISPFTVLPLSIGVGMLAGPSMGALAASRTGLSILYIAISLTALIGMSLIVFCRSEDNGERLPPALPVSKWDYGGLLAIAFVLSSILVISRTLKGEIPVLFGSVFASGLIVAAYLLIDRSDETSDSPVVDINFLMKETNLIIALVMSSLSFAATYVIAYVLPFYIYYNLLGDGGVMLLGGTIVFVPLGFVFGPLIFETFAHANVVQSFWVAALVFFVALVGFALSELTGHTAWLLVGGAALGAMRGIFITPYNKITLDQVAVYRIDETSSYSAIARYFGMGLGALAGSALVVGTVSLGDALLKALLVATVFMGVSVALIPSVTKDVAG